MLEFDVYLAITALSALVIISYLFSLVSLKTRIPTVLMLLLLGVGIHELLVVFDFYVELPVEFVQFFGVLGLILILLEAGLDLNLSREKLPLARRATASAVFVLVFSVVGIAAIMHLGLHQPWLTSLVYAVPLGIISSTIVASSISYLGEEKREFLTYESALSDIIGILLFNILIAGEALSLGIIALNVGSIVLALVVSVVVSILLVFLLARTKMNIKAFLIIAVLLLIYSLGQIWQLPTLLTVLIFGLIINNWRQIGFQSLHRYLGITSVEKTAETVKSVNTESAFLVRTLFFTMFGYMIDVRQLADPLVLIVGSAIVAMILAVRFVYLRLFMRQHVLPELFFSPRGLVTIVLFYSIPTSMEITEFDDGIVFFVVLATTVIMMIGSVWFTPKEATREAEEAGEVEAADGAQDAEAPASGDEGDPADRIEAAERADRDSAGAAERVEAAEPTDHAKPPETTVPVETVAALDASEQAEAGERPHSLERHPIPRG